MMNEEINFAAFNGELDKVKLFLSQGVDINARNIFRMTPLMSASVQGSLDLINYLIEAGADLNLTDFWGRSALITAITGTAESSIKKEVVLALLRAGANPNIGGEPPTHPYVLAEATRPCVIEAAWIGEFDIINICLGFGARLVPARYVDYSHRVPGKTKEAIERLLGSPLSLESQAIRLIRSLVSSRSIPELPLPPRILRKCFDLPEPSVNEQPE